MRRKLSLLLFLGCCLAAFPQRQITVLDMDTHLPVSKVSVRVGGKVFYSDVVGRVVIDTLADTLSFSHLRYLPERLRSYEVGDTMFLLPQDHILEEVVVMELNPNLKSLVSSWARQGALMGAAEAPKGVAQFDFGMMLDRRGRRDRKHMERAKEILGKWSEADVYKDCTK